MLSACISYKPHTRNQTDEEEGEGEPGKVKDIIKDIKAHGVSVICLPLCVFSTDVVVILGP